MRKENFLRTLAQDYTAVIPLADYRAQSHSSQQKVSQCIERSVINGTNFGWCFIHLLVGLLQCVIVVLAAVQLHHLRHMISRTGGLKHSKIHAASTATNSKLRLHLQHTERQQGMRIICNTSLVKLIGHHLLPPHTYNGQESAKKQICTLNKSINPQLFSSSSSYKARTEVLISVKYVKGRSVWIRFISHPIPNRLFRGRFLQAT